MNLTEEQFETFKEEYANVLVTNMTLEECQELIFHQICSDFDDMSFDDIVNESHPGDEKLINELVQEVTSNDVNMNVQL